MAESAPQQGPEHGVSSSVRDTAARGALHCPPVPSLRWDTDAQLDPSPGALSKFSCQAQNRDFGGELGEFCLNCVSGVGRSASRHLSGRERLQCEEYISKPPIRFPFGPLASSSRGVQMRSLCFFWVFGVSNAHVMA
jgi:hypothetical protein